MGYFEQNKQVSKVNYATKKNKKNSVDHYTLII